MILPPRNFLLLILAFALINPLHYAVMAATAPEGRVFLSYVDDAFQLALMKSVVWNFQSPWDFGTSVFENPFLGASYTFVILGTIPAMLNFNIFFVFMLVKFILSVIYLVLIYNIMRYFLESEEQIKLGYLLFLFSAGIGSFIYVLFSLFSPQYAPIVGYALTSEFDELGGGVHAISHLTRIYWLLPEITGLVSLLLFINGRYLISGLFLGLTILFYPAFALGFALLILVYFLMKNYNADFFRKAVKHLLPVAVISAAFAVPWILNYMKSPQYFAQYRLWFSGLPPVTLAVSFFFTLALALYGLRRSVGTLLNRKWYVFLFLLFSGLSSLMHLYAFSGGSALLKEWLASAALLGFSQTLHANAILIDLPLMLLFALLFVDIMRKHMPEKYKFSVLWIISVAAITVISAQFVFWWPARMRWFLLIPLCIAAVKGFDYLPQSLRLGNWKIRITKGAVLAGVILFSLPSVLAFNVYMQQVAHSNNLVYVSQADFEAMQFLRSQPDGRVMSLHQIGNNAPFFTGKKSVLFNEARDARMQDTIAFYSSASQEERLAILDKYQIVYVFYGENEQKTGAVGDLPFLEKIYDGRTKVYKVAHRSYSETSPP